MNRGAQELFAYENLIKLQTAIEQHIQWWNVSQIREFHVKL